MGQLLLDMIRKYELANLRNSYWTSNYIIWICRYPNKSYSNQTKSKNNATDCRSYTSYFSLSSEYRMYPAKTKLLCSANKNHTKIKLYIFLTTIWKLLITLILEKNANVYMIKSIIYLFYLFYFCFIYSWLKITHLHKKNLCIASTVTT